MPGAHRPGECRDTGDMLPGPVPDRRTVVQSGEDGARGDGEIPAGGLVREAGGVGRQVAVGAEFDPLVARLGDLVEESLPGHLLWIVGEPHPHESGAEPMRMRAEEGTEEVISPTLQSSGNSVKSSSECPDKVLTGSRARARPGSGRPAVADSGDGAPRRSTGSKGCVCLSRTT